MEEKAKCEEVVRQIYENPKILFILRAIRNKGCGDKFEIKCENCKEIGIGDQGASFYDPTENLIVLCEDRVRLSTREVIVNTSHELVHAFDFCRADITPTASSCEEVACMEIRASMLSGECDFHREFFFRRNLNISTQFQECVKRRVGISLSLNPNCPKGKADYSISKVWDVCFNDREPFGFLP